MDPAKSGNSTSIKSAGAQQAPREVRRPGSSTRSEQNKTNEGGITSTSEISRSANEFAVDLFQCYLRRHGDKYINLLLCPYLIYHSLAMMLVGASGPTGQQLSNLLRLKQNPPTTATNHSSVNSNQHNNRHKEFLVLTEQLIHGNHDFVHLASFIYLDKTIKRTEEFKEILRDYYETKPKKIDFGDIDQTVKTINEDVARTTENIYSDILSKQEAAKLEKSMLLVNAVFFRGFWLTNFTDVTKAPFTRSAQKDLRTSDKAIVGLPAAKQASSNTPDNHTTSTNNTNISNTNNTQMIDMMSKLDYMAVLVDEQLDARIVKMPFEASDLQMMLILPNDRHSNAAYLCDKITASKIEQVFNDLGHTKHRSTHMSMPVFCIDSGKISIQSTLVTMGASDLFDKNKADMSGLCKNKSVWLNKILHRCFIICDNRGSITSHSYERVRKKHVASLKKDGSMSFKKLIGVEEFTVDHPFMYIIMDSVTKTILLIGLYTEPSETLEVIHENQLTVDEAHQIYTEGFYKT